MEFSLLLFLLLSVILNYSLRLDFFFSKDPKKQIQDVHMNNPSRLGGLTLYILFFGYETLFLGKFNIYFGVQV